MYGENTCVVGNTTLFYKNERILICKSDVGWGGEMNSWEKPLYDFLMYVCEIWRNVWNVVVLPICMRMAYVEM